MTEVVTAGKVLRDRGVSRIEPFPMLLGTLALINSVLLYFVPFPSVEYGHRGVLNIVYGAGFVVCALCLLFFPRLRGFGTAFAIGLIVGMVPVFLADALGAKAWPFGSNVYNRETFPLFPYEIQYLVLFLALAVGVLLVVTRDRVGMGRKQWSPLLIGGLVVGAVEAAAVLLPDFDEAIGGATGAGFVGLSQEWWLFVSAGLALLVPALACTFRPLRVGIGIAGGFILARAAELAAITWEAGPVGGAYLSPAPGFLLHEFAVALLVVWLLLMAARSRAPQEVADEA